MYLMKSTTSVSAMNKFLTTFKTEQIRYSILRKTIHTDHGQLQNKSVKFESNDEFKTFKILPENETDNRNFVSIFPSFVDEVLRMKKYMFSPIITARTRKLLYHCVPNNENQLRASVFFSLYRSMLSARSVKLNEPELRLMYIMGWCLELSRTFSMLADDILFDNATERNGNKCWHVLQTDEGNPKTLAMNDCNFLNGLPYLILHDHFLSKDYYTRLTELFHDISIRTINARAADLLMARANKTSNKSEDLFSTESYRKLTVNKTTYQTFLFPFETALLMSGSTANDESYNEVTDILKEMGTYYHTQNDYVDCFPAGLTATVGKAIENGKSTWLILNALKYSTDERKKLLLNYYGTNHENAIRIKEIYKDMRLPALYDEYEVKTYNSIVDKIRELQQAYLRDALGNILESIRTSV